LSYIGNIFSEWRIYSEKHKYKRMTKNLALETDYALRAGDDVEFLEN
jgi:hypothetical protein